MVYIAPFLQSQSAGSIVEILIVTESTNFPCCENAYRYFSQLGVCYHRGLRAQLQSPTEPKARHPVLRGYSQLSR